jgi:tetratricopeptide (TPR) repeat protein
LIWIERLAHPLLPRRAKEYAQAVEHYTVSLGFQPSNTSVRGNRAAAYIKLRMWNEAVADCDVALESDANNIKARVRRAAARMELGKAAEAMEVSELVRATGI